MVRYVRGGTVTIDIYPYYTDTCTRIALATTWNVLRDEVYALDTVIDQSNSRIAVGSSSTGVGRPAWSRI